MPTLASLITPEFAGEIGKVLLGWGAPGIIIMFLWEHNRRLSGKVDELQKSLLASVESKLELSKEIFSLMREHEKAYGVLQSAVNTLLNFVQFRSNKNDA